MRADTLRAVLCATTLAASALLGSCAVGAPASERLMLSEGVYRLEGVCTSMTAYSEEQKSRCDSFALMAVSSPKQRRFVFVRVDRTSWVFYSTGRPRYSNGGATATFRVNSVMDTSVVLGWDVSGECILNATEMPTLACHVGDPGFWLRAVTFNGNGSWSYSQDVL